MRKFKIKNRQKRKYTRKNQFQSPFYLYKSFAFSLIPIFLIITAAFSMVLLINNKALIKQQPEINITLPSTPNISFSNFFNYTQNVKNSTFQAANKTFYTTTQITQNIYRTLTKTQQYFDPQPFVSKITNTVPPVINNTGKIISIFTQQIGISIQKFIYSSFNFANFLTSVFENKITNLYTISIKVILSIITTVNSTIINFVNITNVLITKTISALSNTLSSIYKLIPPMLHAIRIIIMNILLTIFNTLQLIENTIKHFLKQLLNIIKSPFIELNNEMQPLLLYINKTVKILKHSTNHLTTNSKTLFKFIDSRTQSPPSLTLQNNSGIF